MHTAKEKTRINMQNEQSKIKIDKKIFGLTDYDSINKYYHQAEKEVKDTFQNRVADSEISITSQKSYVIDE